MKTVTSALAPVNKFAEFVEGFAWFVSMNLIAVQTYAANEKAKLELAELQKQCRAPAVNGKTIGDIRDDRALMTDPKGRAAVLKWVHGMLVYLEPRLSRFLNNEGKRLFMPKIDKLKKQYTELVNAQT